MLKNTIGIFSSLNSGFCYSCKGTVIPFSISLQRKCIINLPHMFTVVPLPPKWRIFYPSWFLIYTVELKSNTLKLKSVRV